MLEAREESVQRYVLCVASAGMREMAAGACWQCSEVYPTTLELSRALQSDEMMREGWWWEGSDQVCRLARCKVQVCSSGRAL